LANIALTAQTKGTILVTILAVAVGYFVSSPNIRDSTLTSTMAHADSSTVNPSELLQNPYNLDPESIAQKVHLLVNQHREDNGRPTLVYDPQLASIALTHSMDMAENEYFSHYAKDGGPVDRAEQAGYYCHKAIGNGYYTEGISENLAMNLVHEPIVTFYNDVPEYDWLTEDELAESIFNQWKTTQENNDNLLWMHFDSHGLGIVAGIDGTVYATENFC
jgi:uncharacterized protein YkwD